MKRGSWVKPGQGEPFRTPTPRNVFAFHTPICIIFPSHSFLNLFAFEWGQSSSSWEVTVLDWVSLPPKFHLDIR